MQLELTDCDKEQIQFIDYVQPYGALIALDENDLIINLAATDEFGLSTLNLGQNIREVLKGDTSSVLAMLGERMDPTRPMLIRSKVWSRWMTCVAHKSGEVRVLEFEFLPRKEVEIPSLQFLKDRREPLYRYLNHITDNLLATTGYDRIMVYRFAPDWNGEVVAESIKPGAYSFQGHHFPASDIPLPARELFLKNWVRAIFDVDATPMPLISGTETPLDLTRSALRSPSLIHLEYLRNMGVKASLTLSLIHEGRLWGLIACHNFEPKYITSEERNVCSLIAKLVSTRISSFITAEAMAAIQRVSSFTSELAGDLSDNRLEDAVRNQKGNLGTFLSSDGFCSAPTFGDDFIREGETPSQTELKVLVVFLENMEQDVVHTEKLNTLAPGLERVTTAAGLLAIRLDDCWLMWFRKEFQKSRLWAGNPNKTAYEGDTATRLSPRLSFEAWTEEVKDTSKPWETSDVTAATMLRTEILRTLDGTRSVTSSGMSEYQEILQSLYLQTTDEYS
jgi:chemotaxis family two-component system sensor kinase Cph1